MQTVIIANAANMQTQMQAVDSAMQAANWQLTTSIDENVDGWVQIVRSYTGAATLQTDGSSEESAQADILDDCEFAQAGIEVQINCITVKWSGEEDNCGMHVGVQHTCEEDGFLLCGDGGIEKAISKLIGIDVLFAEIGEQSNGYMCLDCNGVVRDAGDIDGDY